MLRDLEFVVRDGRIRERGHESFHVAIAALGTKAAARLVERRGHPAHHHLAIAPSFPVSGVRGDAAVQVLDRVGGSQGFVEGVLDAEARINVSVSSRPSRRLAAAPGWGLAREFASRSSCRLARRGSLLCQASFIVRPTLSVSIRNSPLRTIENSPPPY
jgi:hypothetical protein